MDQAFLPSDTLNNCHYFLTYCTLLRSGISSLSKPTSSATFKKSETLSILVINFLYMSSPSLQPFLFMSKYFSINKRESEARINRHGTGCYNFREPKNYGIPLKKKKRQISHAILPKLFAINRGCGENMHQSLLVFSVYRLTQFLRP